jgi:hypothetical protein
MKIVYLAAPYSHTDSSVIESRMKVFYTIDAQLMSKGVFTVSPLLKHQTLPYGNLPGDWAYWGAYSEALLERCDEMIVIELDGWKTSTGVIAEIEFCKTHDIPVTFIDPNNV